MGRRCNSLPCVARLDMAKKQDKGDYTMKTEKIETVFGDLRLILSTKGNP